MEARQTELKIATSDGSTVSVALFGDPSLSHPVFYFHGYPGSRLECELGHNAAKQLGLTLVAFDRFSNGLKIPEPGRRPWPRRLSEIADHLGIKRFSQVAVSGGTPTALECAHALGERVISTTIVSGVAPVTFENCKGMIIYNRLLLRLGITHPGIAKIILRGLAAWWHTRPSDMIWILQFFLGGDDRRILRDTSAEEIFLTALKEGLSGQPELIVQEFFLILSMWSFREENFCSKLFVWHGLSDRYVPCAMGKEIANKLRAERTTFPENRGHFMVAELILQILVELKEAAIKNREI